MARARRRSPLRLSVAVWGSGAGRAALLARSGRLARESSGVVAFLWGPSRGSVSSRCARPSGRVGLRRWWWPAGARACLTSLAASGSRAASVLWPRTGGWPTSTTLRSPESDHADPGWAASLPCRRVSQSRHLLDHISVAEPGGAALVEQGIVAGGTVLIPHEALSDTPAFLTVPRLMRGSAAPHEKQRVWPSCSCARRRPRDRRLLRRRRRARWGVAIHHRGSRPPGRAS